MFANDTFKKVKIVATLGPACEAPHVIASMIDAGTDVFRLNMSHLAREHVRSRIAAIRKAEKAAGRSIAVMGDLAGPKIRIGEIPGEHRLSPGAAVTIVREKSIGSDTRLSINHPAIIDSLRKGAHIFLGDGSVKLKVERVTPAAVTTKVIAGGILRSRMGFSAQGLVIRGTTLSVKDKADIAALCAARADAIAISFVQGPNDIRAVRKFLPKHNPPMLIAKIETASGVHRAEKILREADGIMIARGDLGFAVPLASVPHIQKHLIRLGRRFGKPVITATQMLESMIENHMPTRAEISDVANAILDGTDAVMLSAETATGKYPLRAVETMRDVIVGATLQMKPDGASMEDSVAGAVSNAVVSLAYELRAKLIVVLTETGSTARRISSHRPREPILVCSPNLLTIRRMNFTWGVIPLHAPGVSNFDQALKDIRKIVMENDTIGMKRQDVYIVSAGVPFGRSGTTNLALVQQVE